MFDDEKAQIGTESLILVAGVVLVATLAALALKGAFNSQTRALAASSGP